MKTNDAGVSLIKSFESFVPNWYPDPAHGWKVPTIGYGHTDSAGSPKYATSKSMKLTEAEATAILLRDLEEYEADVNRLVKVPLNENQFAALVSFTYNLGASNLNSSTLLRKLNTADYAGAAAEFARWNKAGGRTLKGLTRRRAAERALFETPVSSPRPKPKPVPVLPAYTAPVRGKPAGGSVIAVMAAAIAALAAFIGLR